MGIVALLPSSSCPPCSWSNSFNLPSPELRRRYLLKVVHQQIGVLVAVPTGIPPTHDGPMSSHICTPHSSARHARELLGFPRGNLGPRQSKEPRDLGHPPHRNMFVVLRRRWVFLVTGLWTIEDVEVRHFLGHLSRPRHHDGACRILVAASHRRTAGIGFRSISPHRALQPSPSAELDGTSREKRWRAQTQIGSHPSTYLEPTAGARRMSAHKS